MDGPWDTSSIPSGTQWSLLPDCDRSFPLSHNSRKPFHQLIGARGQCPSSTNPTQPVIVPIHSENASSHLNPAPRMSKTGRRDELPPVSDFTVDAILASLKPEVEGTIDAIAEILGRSKLSLANEYDSHMPPQGEIRATSGSALLPVEEARSSNEHMVTDDVVIVPEDASLIEGSHSGSAAYSLLERLIASPPARRTAFQPRSPSFSPAVFEDVEEARPPNASGSLLNNSARATEPTVSETHLLAGASPRLASALLQFTENDPALYYDSSNLVDADSKTLSQSCESSSQAQIRNLPLISDVRGLVGWLHRIRKDPNIPEDAGASEDAESRLRMILTK